MIKHGNGQSKRTKKKHIQGYFTEDGEDVRRNLIKTPVRGGTLSSRFGMRKHPILGYTRKHQGIDFRARRGTPIIAAGDGVVVSVAVSGGYGKRVILRHGSKLRTLYAHMSRFANGIRRGVRVKQGDVIGFVGATGLASGPHLHYEVHHRMRPVNPLSLKQSTRLPP